MKKLNTQKWNKWAMFSLVIMTMIAASCSKSDTEDDNPTQDENNGGNTSITNNTVMHADATGALEKYTILYTENDVNNGGDSYEISAWTGDFLALADNYLRVFLNEVPAASKTYTWQTAGNSPGALTNDEFFVQVRVNGQTWYGVYTSTAWSASGSLQVTVDGDKTILSFSEIELSDNFISTNVTETKKISGKITIDKNADISDGTNNFTFELLD